MPPFGVPIPATVPQRSEIPEGLTNYPVCYHLAFACPCIASIIVNDDQKDATILGYLFIPSQLD